MALCEGSGSFLSKYGVLMGSVGLCLDICAAVCSRSELGEGEEEGCWEGEGGMRCLLIEGIYYWGWFWSF